MIREKLHAYARHVEANGGDDWVFDFVAEGHPMRKSGVRCGGRSSDRRA